MVSNFRIMKKYILLLLSVVFLFSCSDSDETSSPETRQAPLTVMSYFIADNNLAGDLALNILHTYEALRQMDEQATYLVYWNGPALGSFEIIKDFISWDKIRIPNYWETPRILKYTTDGRGKVNGTSFTLPQKDAASYDTLFKEYAMNVMQAAQAVKVYDHQLATDPAVMSQALKDMAAAAPTQRLGLIAGSHGSGWLKYIAGWNNRSFGQDGSIDNTMSTASIAGAIKSVGRTFDFMLFDACMMGCAEVCYDFKDAVDYMIASPINVPRPGFPYVQMLRHLYTGTEAGYTKACQAYINRYLNEPSKDIRFGTISLIDCRKMQALADELKPVIVGHKELLSHYDPFEGDDKLQQFGEKGTNFVGYSFDIIDFVRKMENGTVPASLQKVFDEAVLYTGFVPGVPEYLINAEQYSGLGLYVPYSRREGWNDYFKTISWYQAAGWDQVPF